MLCKRCKVREANIRYTEIINRIKTEHNLCSHRARETDFGQYVAILDGKLPLGELLSGLLGLEDDEGETDVRGKMVCSICGTSFNDFMENSRFGCPDCYGVLNLLISDETKQLQGSENHKGKHPKFRSIFEKEHLTRINAGEIKETADSTAIQENGMDSRSVVANKQIRELETRSEEVAKQKEYELAAQCRDQTKELKKEADIYEWMV